MTSRMTATDELHRLLDERGVEYRVSATGYSIDIGPNMTAYANRTDTTLDVSLRGFTPEQAVEATLGSDLKAENAKLRELVRDLWLAGSLCDAIPAVRLQAKGGDWRTMQERVDEALGIEVDA